MKRLINFVIGTSDILFGYYPGSRAQTVRRVFTGLGVAVTISEALNGSDYAAIAALMYIGGRFGPYFAGYRERWRF